MSCTSTTITGSVIIAVSIATSKLVAVASVVTVAIAIIIDIDIAIVVDIAIAIAIQIPIPISIYTTIDIIFDADMGFHLWFQGTYQLFQCPDLSTDAIICGVEMFDFLQSDVTVFSR